MDKNTLSIKQRTICKLNIYLFLNRKHIDMIKHIKEIKPEGKDI